MVNKQLNMNYQKWNNLISCYHILINKNNNVLQFQLINVK